MMCEMQRRILRGLGSWLLLGSWYGTLCRTSSDSYLHLTWYLTEVKDSGIWRDTKPLKTSNLSGQKSYSEVTNVTCPNPTTAPSTRLVHLSWMRLLLPCCWLVWLFVVVGRRAVRCCTTTTASTGCYWASKSATRLHQADRQKTLTTLF